MTWCKKTIRNCLLILTTILASCSRDMHTAKIVLLPDTQTYAEKFPHILDSQVNWIVKNAKNIDFVLQQGDLTQNNNDKEWLVVQSAFNKLNNKVPYVLALGNHDMGS
ncbi:MAG TPA: metallophosphoesterase, partial [Chitinophagaceae bacterium]|nr:metallophosphoesterase [Chitinophagaceae bacterium]